MANSWNSQYLALSPDPWSKYKDVSNQAPISKANTADAWSKYKDVTNQAANSPSNSGGILSDIAHFGQGALQYGMNVNQGLDQRLLNAASDMTRGFANKAKNIGLGADSDALNSTAPQLGKANIFNLFHDPGAQNSDAAKAGSITNQLLTGLAMPLSAETKLGSLAEGAGQGATFGALNAAANPNQNIGVGAGIGAALGAPGELLGNTVSNYMSGLANKAAAGVGDLRTPQDVQTLSSMVSPKTDFGSMVGSPGLANLANKTLPNAGVIPFVGNPGMKAAQKVLVDNTNSSANDILNALRGTTNPEDIPTSLRDAVSQNNSNARGFVGSLYDGIANEANNRGVGVTAFPAVNAALKKIQYDGDVLPDSGFVNELRTLPSEDPSISEQSQSNGAPNEENDQNYNYSQAHTLSTQAGRLQRKTPFDNGTLANQYGQLHTALKSDLADALSNSGNPDLSDALNNTNQLYKSQVLPYSNMSLQKILGGQSDVNGLPNLLKKSQMAKVVADLAPADKNQLGYQLLQGAGSPDAMGDITAAPQQLLARYNKIPANVQSQLFDDGTQDQMNAVRAQLGTQQSVRQALKPSDGTIQQYLTAAKPMLPAGIATAASPHLAIPAFVGTGLASHLANTLLRSQALRNAYINPMTSGLAHTNQLAALFRYPAISGVNNAVQGAQ